MYFNMPRDRFTAKIYSPVRDPLSSPVVLKVKVVARDSDFDCTLVDVNTELRCTFPELSVDISIHEADYFISTKKAVI